MRKARSRFEIVTEILMLLAEGVHKPTHFMSRARLAWYPLMGYLDRLSGAGLVYVNPREFGKRTVNAYSITPKGIEFLTYAKRNLNIMKEMYKEEK